MSINTHDLLTLLFSLCLVTVGCSPTIPSKDVATLLLKQYPDFPFFFADFTSVELGIAKVDETYEVPYKPTLSLFPGPHSVCVAVTKGPHSFIPGAPLSGAGQMPLGICCATLKFTAETGSRYEVGFDKVTDPVQLRLYETESRAVLAYAPCTSVPFLGWLLPCDYCQ